MIETGFGLDESGTDGVECCRKVVIGRKVAGAIRFLVSARSLQLECPRVPLKTFLMPVLLYGSETMVWRDNERSRIRAVQIDNLRGLLGIRRMDRVLNARRRVVLNDEVFTDDSVKLKE